MRNLVCALVCLVAAAGCGGSKTSPSPTQQPYNQTMSGTTSGLGYTVHSLTIPRAGNMGLNLSWLSDADLDLYLTSASCQDVYPMGNCQMLAVSDRSGAGSESIQRTVAEGEAFKVWVDNFSVNPQNYTLTINIQ
jgi:hypothetical protein